MRRHKARGRDKRKRKPRQAEPCPHPIWSIHEHLSWYRDEGGYTTHRDGQQTYARAGSMQKVEVMRERVDNGEPLFVDGDGEVDLS